MALKDMDVGVKILGGIVAFALLMAMMSNGDPDNDAWGAGERADDEALPDPDHVAFEPVERAQLGHAQPVRLGDPKERVAGLDDVERARLRRSGQRGQQHERADRGSEESGHRRGHSSSKPMPCAASSAPWSSARAWRSEAPVATSMPAR